MDERIEAEPVEPVDHQSALMEAVCALARTGSALVAKVDGLETNVARAVRRRTLLIVVAASVGLVVLVIGAWMVRDQRQGNEQRQQLAVAIHEIRAAVKEIKDCTTPADQTTPCQQRLAEGQEPVLAALSEDNLRASIAVGSCLRSGDPDVFACSMRRFEQLRAEVSP